MKETTVRFDSFLFLQRRRPNVFRQFTKHESNPLDDNPTAVKEAGPHPFSLIDLARKVINGGRSRREGINGGASPPFRQAHRTASPGGSHRSSAV